MCMWLKWFPKSDMTRHFWGQRCTHLMPCFVWRSSGLEDDGSRQFEELHATIGIWGWWYALARPRITAAITTPKVVWEKNRPNFLPFWYFMFWSNAHSVWWLHFFVLNSGMVFSLIDFKNCLGQEAYHLGSPTCGSEVCPWICQRKRKRIPRRSRTCPRAPRIPGRWTVLTTPLTMTWMPRRPRIPRRNAVGWIHWMGPSSYKLVYNPSKIHL